MVDCPNSLLLPPVFADSDASMLIRIPKQMDNYSHKVAYFRKRNNNDKVIIWL